MHDSDRFANVVYGFCALIILLLAVQWIIPPRMPEVKLPDPLADCVGEPLSVPYAYTGGVNEPWACQVQCDDQKQRYLSYTNGVFTQCEMLPGCNDTGEDSGVTCRAPLISKPIPNTASSPAGL